MSGEVDALLVTSWPNVVCFLPSLLLSARSCHHRCSRIVHVGEGIGHATEVAALLGAEPPVEVLWAG